MASNGTEIQQLTEEERNEIREKFFKIDQNGDGFIDLKEIRDALEHIGIKIPGYQSRQIEDEFKKKDKSRDGKLSYDEFEKLCLDFRNKDVAKTFRTAVSKRENLTHLGGTSEASNVGTTHSVRVEERLAFSDWINSNLQHDPDLKNLLPIDAEGVNLYEKVKDGILLCKIINHSCPDTIDERTINKGNKMTLYTKLENLTLALASASAIGCNVINIDAHSLEKGTPHLVLGLLWQIIRIGLFNQITLEHCPGLTTLLGEDEEIGDLLKLSPEAILLRWVNYHLERAGVQKRVHNFQSDVVDSEAYTHLLKQIAPPEAGVTTEALMERDYLSRAEIMLQQAAKLGCRAFVTPQDVVNGTYKLNLAFVANLFNNHPRLEQQNGTTEFETIETREERTYRNWMNSIGVSPRVNWLYSDLSDGLIVFQLFDIIQPGVVEWNRVTRKFTERKKFMEKLENCNYAVELGKKVKFSLVGIAGQDISEGNVTLTLALVWQLMRAYTLSVLKELAKSDSPIVEKEIVTWVNQKLEAAGKKSSIKGFQDPIIADAKVVIDLIDAIKPGAINYDLVKTGGQEENLENAKYAISMSRKIGARAYALPEDIVEVKPKMVMTVFACLMALDYHPNMGDNRQ